MTLRPRRGTTLIEAMVYMSLMGFVFFCIYGVLISSLKYFRIAEKSAEIQGTAMTTVVKLVNEMSEARSAVDSIIIGSSPEGLIFVSPRDSSDNKVHVDSATNQILWQKVVCYYIGDQQADNSGATFRSLMRKEFLFTTNALKLDGLIPTSHDTTAEFKNDGSLDAVVVGRYIRSIKFPDFLNGSRRIEISAFFAAQDYPSGVTSQTQMEQFDKDAKNTIVNVQTHVIIRN